MSTPEQAQAFDVTAYDLPGTPKLRALKANKVSLSIDRFELDRTDAEHMRIAGLLEDGNRILLRLELGYAGATWDEQPDKLGRSYRYTIEDIVAT